MESNDFEERMTRPAHGLRDAIHGHRDDSSGHRKPVVLTMRKLRLILILPVLALTSRKWTLAQGSTDSNAVLGR